MRHACVYSWKFRFLKGELGLPYPFHLKELEWFYSNRVSDPLVPN